MSKEHLHGGIFVDEAAPFHGIYCTFARNIRIYNKQCEKLD
ncbi:hypothetical protein BACCOPRO_00067 [Phocaeicola coprophilus DSM 18228 = JCM 13818]|jgi:hypothetical protein|uniref:Uncharacterized protein n=1 Tax=Phocaeicola coprophilus DSM 18228 = JCM 13818 TaxID=547042 RepID=S0F3Z5_9BACT|nr:hypothetical protein BACCOPRO_00067 [Phocaeicola coprophilus DSM 18228 = JCM 13818]